MPVRGARPAIGAVVTLVVALALTERRASGDEAAACGRRGRPWVGVHTPDDLPRSLSSFVGLLRAELASRGIDLCTSVDAGQEPPLATIEVSSAPDSVALGVEVRDALTAKHVSREVALGGVPADSRPLTIALAADELLRASWAELALRTAAPPALPVPVEVTKTVRETIEPAVVPASAPQFLLGVDGALQRFGSGTTMFGADARLGAWWTRRVAAGLRFGLLSGGVVSASDGSVQPSAWIAGAAAIVTVTPPEYRWGIDALGRFDVEHISFVAMPRGTATGSSQSDYALLAGLGPQAWFRILPTLRVGAEVLAMIPLRGVEAADAHVNFAGASGVGLSTQLGLWSTL
jgi:hypothetical protein